MGCWFGGPVVNGDRAAVEPWAILRRLDCSPLTIAGTAILRFAAHRLLLGRRDYWDERDDAAEPPEGNDR